MSNMSNLLHYNDVIMREMASQSTSLTIVYSTVYSRRRSKKTWKLRVTGLCEGNSPGTGEFPAQMASDAENVSIWWRRYGVQFPRKPKSINTLETDNVVMGTMGTILPISTPTNNKVLVLWGNFTIKLCHSEPKLCWYRTKVRNIGPSMLIVSWRVFRALAKVN